MNKKRDSAGLWSTSSFGSPPDTAPTELAALVEHLVRCTGMPGRRFFALKCAGDALNDFVAPRLVTTLALFLLLSAVASLLI